MFDSADSYDRFMGRYSVPLAAVFADFAGIGPGQTALDVGCGPGALTRELSERLGVSSVSAVDPSESFIAALAHRVPGVDARVATAEDLPFADARFDAAVAQLVVHFMADPVRGLREVKRVTTSGGVVAACVWDYSNDGAPLTPFWAAARDLDPEVVGESNLAGARQGHLGELFTAAGLDEVEEDLLAVEVAHTGFDDWWEPFTLGVGPAGQYLGSLDPGHRSRLAEHARSRMPDGPFTLDARAWAARGRA